MDLFLNIIDINYHLLDILQILWVILSRENNTNTRLREGGQQELGGPDGSVRVGAAVGSLWGIARGTSWGKPASCEQQKAREPPDPLVIHRCED